jgi:hypothetical protein
MGWENNQNTLPAAGREEEPGHVGEEEAGKDEEEVEGKFDGGRKRINFLTHRENLTMGWENNQNILPAAGRGEETETRGRGGRRRGGNQMAGKFGGGRRREKRGRKRGGNQMAGKKSLVAGGGKREAEDKIYSTNLQPWPWENNQNTYQVAGRGRTD